jgi:hypothetical protein
VIVNVDEKLNHLQQYHQSESSGVPHPHLDSARKRPGSEEHLEAKRPIHEDELASSEELFNGNKTLSN